MTSEQGSRGFYLSPLDRRHKPEELVTHIIRLLTSVGLRCDDVSKIAIHRDLGVARVVLMTSENERFAVRAIEQLSSLMKVLDLRTITARPDLGRARGVRDRSSESRCLPTDREKTNDEQAAEKRTEQEPVEVNGEDKASSDTQKSSDDGTQDVEQGREETCASDDSGQARSLPEATVSDPDLSSAVVNSDPAISPAAVTSEPAISTSAAQETHSGSDARCTPQPQDDDGGHKEGTTTQSGPPSKDSNSDQLGQRPGGTQGQSSQERKEGGNEEEEDDDDEEEEEEEEVPGPKLVDAKTSTPMVSPCHCPDTVFYLEAQYVGVETRHAEFKSAGFLKYEFATAVGRYLCGFFNSGGGALYVGVNDDGRVEGVFLSRSTLRKTKKGIYTALRTISPPVNNDELVVNVVSVYRERGEGRAERGRKRGTERGTEEPERVIEETDRVVVEICVHPRAVPDTMFSYKSVAYVRREGSLCKVGEEADG